MKKLMLAAVAAVTLGSAAFAADYGAAGCGLGSLVFKENNETQILAATTNGTFANQTFGMTSGTSNCNNKGLIKLSMVRESFIEANFKDLSRNAAAGKGEFVGNLATLYGYGPETTAKFTELLQKNHGTIFASNNARTAVTEINKLVSANS
jgi:opacity protein-like surface antigen